MILLVLAYLGGALTILSPCILPVLPFVFAQSDRPFVRGTLPMLVGMATTFAVVASVATVGSDWVSQANQVGRWLALALMGGFALSLLWPALASRVGAPFQSIGARLSRSVDQEDSSGIGKSILLGVATGLLWAPCAGPILGLVLAGAALQGASTATAMSLLSYGLGAATSLAMALLIGGRVFSAMRRTLGLSEWIRRGLGVVALVSVVAIAFGVDTGLLTRVSTANTARVEELLLERLQPTAEPAETAMMMSANAPSMMMMAADKQNASDDPNAAPEGMLPTLSGANAWLNSHPLDRATLRGKVVLIDFWTYSCINCLRAIPHVREWAEKYKNQGLVVIGVHTPEFAFERSHDNVRHAVKDLKITYPVAIDNDYAIWRGFDNQYWPAHYFIDAEGRIRAHHFGEGDYAESEAMIRKLLAEAGNLQTASAPSTPAIQAEIGAGVTMESDSENLLSSETYIGYDRAENFSSPGGLLRDRSHRYSGSTPIKLNQWTLDGAWTVGPEDALLENAGGKISFRFHARDLHLVLSRSSKNPVRFRVLIDGHAPSDAHGEDVDANGGGLITQHRLYQLVRQRSGVGEHTFEIEFLDPGVRAYAFTFG